MSDREHTNDILDPATRLRQSWRVNADAWSRAVRERRIPSRRAGTDAAIVEAVLRTNALRVLDLGCGEGWLARALGTKGCEVIGIDASPELIAAASACGGARFEVASYDELGARSATLEPFDAVVCNFALLGADLDTPLRAARAVLRAAGTLLVQTVHPWTARGDAPYVDGWRIETFADFGDGFSQPMPWYFRTLSSWLAGIRACGFVIDDVDEPIDVSSGAPLSLLISASLQIRRDDG
jgi:2-polyprenyl-3-methyl-5-hydroxy-6-metoxy-1,4-benzoquinol methylase